MSALAHVSSAGGTTPPPAPQPNRKGRSWVPYLLLLPGALWLLVFFVIPLGQLFSVSLQSQFPGYPGYYYRDVNVGNYWRALTEFAPHFGRSLLFAGLATFFAFCLAYPLAYAMAFKAGRWRGVMMILVIAPFFISFLLRTLAWKQLMADDTPLVQALKSLSVLPADGHLTGTAFSVIFGLTYNFLPFMTLPIYTTLERLDTRYLEAGADLYASPATTFWKVTLPLSLPGIVSGTLLTFIPASGDYINASSSFLGSAQTQMVGNAIEANFLGLLNYPEAAALSVILMGLILVIVGIYVRRTGTEDLL